MRRNDDHHEKQMLSTIKNKIMTQSEEQNLRMLALEKASLLTGNYSASDLTDKAEKIYQWLLKGKK